MKGLFVLLFAFAVAQQSYGNDAPSSSYNAAPADNGYSQPAAPAPRSDYAQPAPRDNGPNWFQRAGSSIAGAWQNSVDAVNNGVRASVDAVANGVRATDQAVLGGIRRAANFLDKSWDALRLRFNGLRCRVMGGVREFWDESKQGWSRLTDEMNEFVDASKANLREGVEFTFDRVSNTWRALRADAAIAVNFLDAKWDALKARFAGLRCRVRSGVREFFDASRQEWTRMTTEMEQFVDASKANLREGVEFTFDKASNTWSAIQSSVKLSINFLDKKWDALKLRFSRLRCRVRSGVKEFFDASSQQWVRFTADMENFVVASKQNLREGAEFTWDVTSDAWKEVTGSVTAAINWGEARWAGLRRRFAGLRCRVKGGVREFFDASKQAWTRFDNDLSTFADATKAAFTEGVEWVFDSATNTWRSVEASASRVVDWADAFWARLRNRFSGLRCRVRSGVREFFDASKQTWARMDADMERFVDGTKANFREGVEWSFDLVSNTWKAVETLNKQAINILDAKWNSLRMRFYTLKFRVQGGVRQFFDASANAWVRLTAEMEEFADASKANFREGVTWTFDQVSNTWKAIQSDLQAASARARQRDAKNGYPVPAGPVHANTYNAGGAAPAPKARGGYGAGSAPAPRASGASSYGSSKKSSSYGR
jgi:flavin reductase (DIM6/NTAB) family NADH-FMN oxidoreductase RutF/phage pi2 protein 07